MASIKYKDSTTGNMIPVAVKVGDNIPVGAEFDYDGNTIPVGYEEVDNPNNYSTTEQVIGTWIDGKPLYRKAFEFTNSGIFYNGSSYSTGITTVDRLIRCEFKLTNGDNTLVNEIPFFDGSSKFLYQFMKQSGELAFYGSGSFSQSSLRNATIILEYTKTTD